MIEKDFAFILLDSIIESNPLYQREVKECIELESDPAALAEKLQEIYFQHRKDAGTHF